MRAIFVTWARIPIFASRLGRPPRGNSRSHLWLEAGRSVMGASLDRPGRSISNWLLRCGAGFAAKERFDRGAPPGRWRRMKRPDLVCRDSVQDQRVQGNQAIRGLTIGRLEDQHSTDWWILRARSKHHARAVELGHPVAMRRDGVR